MSTENKKSRWNRFEIAFNEGKRPEAAACRAAWRPKTGKTRGLGRLEKMESSKQPLAEEATPSKQPLVEELTNPKQTLAEEPTRSKQSLAEKTAFRKRSSTVVPSFWEQARRAKADAATKKRAESALKSLKSAKSSGSPLEAKEFPFPKRPRTYRSSDPPRRFDDPRKD